MDFRANGRLALGLAAIIAIVALTAKPLLACDSTRSCPSDMSHLNGVAANALPTYPEPTEEASEPIKLKKFTRSQARSARRTQPRKATLSQRARAGEHARAKGEQEKARAETARLAGTAAQLAPLVANAKAELAEADATKVAPAAVSEQIQPAATGVPPSPAGVELVSAEEFNDLDRAAWEANQMPKLMQLTASDSRAELRDDDSKWAQTSTIGKLFVAFGALLTIGSAIRMFIA